jgi:hypothetical protein
LNALDGIGVYILDVNRVNQVDPFYLAGNFPVEVGKLHKIIECNFIFNNKRCDFQYSIINYLFLHIISDAFAYQNDVMMML